MLTEQAGAKHLHLVTDTEMMPHDLLGDPTRLQQALLNYASNALKCTDHGSVTLRTRKLSLDANSLHVHFEVSDTGIGIAPDAMDRLFQPFTQADSSNTRKHGGSGLGLSITRKMAHLRGGKAGGNGRPGLGGTFWFTARLARSGQTERLTPPTEVAQDLLHDLGMNDILIKPYDPQDRVRMLLKHFVGTRKSA